MRQAFYRRSRPPGSAHKRARAKPIIFHELRHTFGTLAVQAWPLSDVQGYMGHQNIQTTMRYIHHVPRTTAAAELTALVDAATAPEVAHTRGTAVLR